MSGMNLDQKSDPICTVIVPIGPVDSGLDNLTSWISQINFDLIQIHLVHDVKYESDKLLLNEITSNLDFKNLVLTTGKFGSPGAARNIGLEATKSDWICFWDSDDIIDPRIFGLALKEITQDSDLIIGNYILQTGQRNSVLQTPDPNDLQRSIVLNPGIWRMIFNRDYINNTRFKDFMMGEDQAFLVELGIDSARIKYIDVAWYTYVRGGQSQLTRSKVAVDSLIATLSFTSQLIAKKGSSSSRFEQMIFAKLALTKVSSGTLKLRLSALFSIFKLLSGLEFVFSMSLIRQMLNLYIYLVKRKFIER